jgi:hypothetical protein
MGQVGLAVALIAAVLAAPQSPQPPQSPPTAAPAEAKGDPGPRTAIAGLRSLECGSTVVYAALPGAPHRLQASYAFPDRARWWLGVGADPSARRKMLFRFGSRCWSVPEDVGVSRRLEAKERDEMRVQLEMRRALFLWPHGFEWNREGRRSTAPLEDLGTLTATFAEASAKNPTALAFTGADGKAGDEYRAIAWRAETDKGKSSAKDKLKEKPWPAKLELWHADALIWTETVVSIDTSTRYIDAYFVPPDTRDNAGATPKAGDVRPLDVPEHRSQRVALPARTTWAAACAERERLVAERTAGLAAHALALDDRATFEVSDALEPVAVVLRLAPCREPLDPAVAKDWPRTNERPALYTFVTGLTSLAPSRLADLRQAVPSDAVSGCPYVRFDPAHPEQSVLLLLPLASKDEVPPKGQ